jgi:hypothetical protein
VTARGGRSFVRRKKFLSCIALRQKSLSFTPGFSLVSSRNTNAENRFNGLPFFRVETVKTVSENARCTAPG